MQNAQNAFNLTASANAFLWQEFRDQADFAFREAENAENRTSQIISTALSADPGKYANSVQSLKNLVNSIIGSAGTENPLDAYALGYDPYGGTGGYRTS